MDNYIGLELNEEALKKMPYLDLLDYLRNTLDEIDPCLVQGKRAIEAMEKLVAYLPSLSNHSLTGKEQAELAYIIGEINTWKR